MPIWSFQFNDFNLLFVHISLSEDPVSIFEWREIVDAVKSEDILVKKLKNQELKLSQVVTDKDGNICHDCTDLQAEFAKNPG